MNIGIDVDDTLTNRIDTYNEYAIKYNKIKNIKYNNDVFPTYNWTKENKLEFDRMFLLDILREATVADNAPYVINELKKYGHNIYIITARNEHVTKDVYNFTRSWLVKNNIYFDELIVNASNKALKCLENNINVFIDDNIRNCNNVYCNTEAYVMLYTIRSNMKYNPPYKRVYNWMDVYREISNLKDEKVLRLK